MHPELPIISFICVALLSILLPVHFKRLSVASISIIIWLLAGNLIHGVNSIIWASDTEDVDPVWCDIVTKALLALNIALPGGILCVCRQIELLCSNRTLEYIENGRKGRSIIDLLICVVLPCVYAASHTFVQSHRFVLVPDYGCTASIYPSIPAVFLIWFPVLAVCFWALAYCGIALYHILVLRPRFSLSQHLATRTTLAANHLVHSLVLSILELTLLIAFGIVSTSLTVEHLLPWGTWGEIHSVFTTIPVQSPAGTEVVFGWWIVPALTFLCSLNLFLGEFKLSLHLPSHRAKEDIPSNLSDSGIALDSSYLPDISSSWVDTSDLPRRARYPMMVSSNSLTPVVTISRGPSLLSRKSERTVAKQGRSTTPPPLPSYAVMNIHSRVVHKSAPSYSINLSPTRDQPQDEVDSSPPPSPSDIAFMENVLQYLEEPSTQYSSRSATSAHARSESSISPILYAARPPLPTKASSPTVPPSTLPLPLNLSTTIPAPASIHNAYKDRQSLASQYSQSSHATVSSIGIVDSTSPWPLPPASVPVSPYSVSPSLARSVSVSGSSSSASLSSQTTLGYGLRVNSKLPRTRTMYQVYPESVRSVSVDGDDETTEAPFARSHSPLPTPASSPALRAKEIGHSRRLSKKGSDLSRRMFGHGHGPGVEDVIYMTVVKETV